MLEMNIIILTALILLAPGTALAYFDAGTGSLIIQGLVGALAFVTVFWGKVMAYIHSLFSTDKDASPSAGADTSVGGDKHTDVDADAEDQH
jgi:hypothetical protein